MTTEPYFNLAFQQQVIDGLSSLGTVAVSPSFDFVDGGGDNLYVLVGAAVPRYAGRYPKGMTVDDICADMRKLAAAKTCPQTP